MDNKLSCTPCFFKGIMLICLLLSSSIHGYSQDGKIHTLMVEPVMNEDMVFDTDSIQVKFKWLEYDATINVSVSNKTDDRIYIEWENARLDNARIAFGDDSRLSMMNPKADETITAKSKSITRMLFAESWVFSDYVYYPLDKDKIMKQGGMPVDLILPIRFNDGKTKDYKFKLHIYYYNPIDCSSITIGMKQADVKKLLGKPDDTFKYGGTTVWYYASNAIIDFEKGVVTKITDKRFEYIR